MKSDADYFRKRAGEERRAALAAGKPSVRLRHLEFAEAYELRLRLIRLLEAETAAELVNVA